MSYCIINGSCIKEKIIKIGSCIKFFVNRKKLQEIGDWVPLPLKREKRKIVAFHFRALMLPRTLQPIVIHYSDRDYT